MNTTGGKHLEMTDGLKTKLEDAGVEPNIVSAIKAMLENAKPAFRAGWVYAKAVEKSFDQFGVPGIKMQIAYALLYFHSWRGAQARACKKELNKWATSSTADTEHQQ